MEQKTSDMVQRIMDTERMGYAYLYPLTGGERKEYLISTTPENMADFIGSHMRDAEKIMITDWMDRRIVDTTGGFLDTCPDPKLWWEIMEYLVPIQMGQEEPGEVLAVDKEAAEEYFCEEERMVTMAELSMG